MGKLKEIMMEETEEVFEEIISDNELRHLEETKNCKENGVQCYFGICSECKNNSVQTS